MATVEREAAALPELTPVAPARWLAFVPAAIFLGVRGVGVGVLAILSAFNNYDLIAMDGPGPHKFNFNEGVSLVVQCGDQAEIDVAGLDAGLVDAALGGFQAEIAGGLVGLNVAALVPGPRFFLNITLLFAS